MYSKEDVKILRKEFWLSFSNYTKFYSKKIGEEIEWVFYKTGIKGVELKFDLDKKSVKVILEINNKNRHDRLQISNEIIKYKSIINEGFDNNMVWVEDYMLPEGKTVYRIYVELINKNYYDKSQWPDILRFMCENMYKLQTNFLSIRDICKESIKLQ
jgi:hypothetical protein